MLVNEQDREIPASRVVQDCRRLVHALREHGVSEADRVLLSADNSADFVLTLFALMELGVSVGLVDRKLPEAACADLVADSGARWFISDHHRPGTGFGEIEDRRLSLVRLSERAASLDEEDDGVGPEEGLTFERWAARPDALLVWSTGSSGKPKGIVRGGESVLNNVRRTQERMGYTAEDVLMPLLPFTHQYGLSLLLLWWQSGATLTVVPSKRIDLAMETISRRGVTVVDAVPAAYHAMLRIMSGRWSASDVDSVRMWCVGGEPLGDDLRRRFVVQVGKPLLDGYGSSEAGNIAVAGPDNMVHCGRPLRGITVWVLGEDGRRLPAGEVGEVVVHTPDLMAGTLEPGGGVCPAGQGNFHTDDVGFLDRNGNLRVLGRRSAVHRFGHTLYPDAIAAKLSGCGAPVRVLPVEDETRGTQLVLLVADPADQPVAHWRRIAGEFLAEYERPNRIVVLPDFPLQSNGKVDLRAIADIAASAVALAGVKGFRPVGHSEVSADELASIPFADRVAQLAAVAEVLRTRRDEVVQVLTEVCNYKTAYGEVDASIGALEGAAAEVKEYGPRAIEQVGVLMPSNIPLYSYVLYLLIPSLYSKRVVFRPSRRIEDQTRKLHELLSGTHGLPIVLDDSDQAEFLNGEGARSDVLVFTGTYRNAEKIRLGLRRDQLFLYFGQGVNPFIVGPGSDLRKAVDGLLRVRMLNSGQDCFGPDVVFVHTSISAQFCNLLCRRVSGLRHGRFEDPAAEYGSMFYLDAFDSSLEYLRKNREYLAAGGEVNFVDNHLRPTVLIQHAETKVTPPELFAPIFNVVPFTSHEWLHEMVDHPYFEERAMAATVFGHMPETVELLRRRHTVSINETLIEVESGNAPFGGTGIRANYAAIGKKRYAQALLLSKAVADHLPGSDIAAEQIA
jgi:acyl-coenzyme A synthetase/AMP-(fatty) acid ligase/acyl-CoA reductase-like NAD-dependent aldehyde dehydrogenase